MNGMNQTEALVEAIKQAERLRLLRIAEQATDIQTVIEYLKRATNTD